MLTFNEKIIMFMKKKQDLLIELGIKDKYIIKKDEKVILSWEEDKCEKIWKKLIHNINEDLTGLSTETCPFCIENKSSTCVGCTYQINHEMCCVDNSTYNKILGKLLKQGYGFSGEPFTKSFYKSIIKEINHMEIFKK